jgi:hypothetical protein
MYVEQISIPATRQASVNEIPIAGHNTGRRANKKKNQTRHQTRLLCLEGDSPALTFNAHIIVFSDGNNCKNAYKARNFW